MVVRQAIGLPKNGLWLPWSLQIQFEKHWPGRSTAILSTRRSGVLATLWAGWPSCEKLVLKGTEDKSNRVPAFKGFYFFCDMQNVFLKKAETKYIRGKSVHPFIPLLSDGAVLLGQKSVKGWGPCETSLGRKTHGELGIFKQKTKIKISKEKM